MEVKIQYIFHTLEKIPPQVLPRNIITLDQILNEYGRKSEKKFPANSLVVAFVPLLFQSLPAVGIANITDTGNTLRTGTTAGYSACPTSAEVGLFGIFLGTGTIAVALADYKLNIPIAHGAGAGQLSYGAYATAANMLYFPAITNGSTNSWSLLRIISNLDTSNLEAKEAGLVIRHATFNFLVERTVLSPTYNFLAKTSVMVEYKASITV